MPFLILFLFFALNHNLAGQLNPSSPTEFIQQEFDVISYDVELNISQLGNILDSGICTTKFVWKNKSLASQFYFHLHGLEIKKIIINGEKYEAKRNELPEFDDFYYSIARNEIPQQDTNFLVIHYSGTFSNEGGSSPWGGVHYVESDTLLYALGVGFQNKYVSCSRHWAPFYDHPSDKALLNVSLTVPSGYIGVANGLLEETIEKDNNQVTYRWKMRDPAATYLYTIAVADYKKLDFGNETLPMSVFAKSRDTNATRYAFQLLPDMNSCFENYFGDYPFESIGYVLTDKGAMEHQTMISYPRNLAISAFQTSNPVNSVAAHELAHQWFGDLVTCQDFKHAWLNESFATFCESLWMECREGKNAYYNNQRQKAISYLNNIVPSEGELPLYHFQRFESSNYPQAIYQKGAVVLGMLRWIMGDDAFFLAINQYLDKYGYNVSNTDAIKASFQKNSSINLDNFFNEWVERETLPRYSASAEKIEQIDKIRKYYVSFTQQDTEINGLFYDSFISVRFFGSGQSLDTILRVESQITDSEIETNFDVSNIIFNPPSQQASLGYLTNISITSVDEIDSKANIANFYPNPSEGLLNIEYNQTTFDSLVIYDYLGAEIISVNLDKSGNETINIQHLTSGTYQVAFVGKDKVVSKNLKIVK